MKNGKLILGVLLALALGYFALREVKQDQEHGVLRTGDLIFPVGSSRVQSLTIELEGRKATYSRNAEGRFTVEVGPAGIDPSLAPDLIGTWSRVHFVELVDENPKQEDLARYGLDPPVAVLTATLKAAEPRPTARMELGQASANKPALYARVDGFPRVILVGIDASDLVIGVGRKGVGLESQAPVEEHR